MVCFRLFFCRRTGHVAKSFALIVPNIELLYQKNDFSQPCVYVGRAIIQLHLNIKYVCYFTFSVIHNKKLVQFSFFIIIHHINWNKFCNKFNQQNNSHEQSVNWSQHSNGFSSSNPLEPCKNSIAPAKTTDPNSSKPTTVTH